MLLFPVAAFSQIRKLRSVLGGAAAPAEPPAQAYSAPYQSSNATRFAPAAPQQQRPAEPAAAAPTPAAALAPAAAAAKPAEAKPPTKPLFNDDDEDGGLFGGKPRGGAKAGAAAASASAGAKAAGKKSLFGATSGVKSVTLPRISLWC